MAEKKSIVFNNRYIRRYLNRQKLITAAECFASDRSNGVSVYLSGDLEFLVFAGINNAGYYRMTIGYRILQFALCADIIRCKTGKNHQGDRYYKDESGRQPFAYFSHKHTPHGSYIQRLSTIIEVYQ